MIKQFKESYYSQREELLLFWCRSFLVNIVQTFSFFAQKKISSNLYTSAFIFIYVLAVIMYILTKNWKSWDGIGASPTGLHDKDNYIFSILGILSYTKEE